MADSSRPAEPSLVRAVGTRGLAAHIVNLTVGGGIFFLPAVVAAGLGAAAPLAYLVCALAMALIVLCFAEAGSRVALTGGPYAYVEVALGPFVGFLSGALLWLVGCFATAAVASGFAGTIGALVPALGGEAGRIGVLAAALAVFAAVNVRGVREGVRLSELATVAKLLPLLLLVGVGLAAVRPEHLAWTAPLQAGDVGRTAIVLIFAFAGVEAALVPSGEVRDPARTVPRALFLALAAVTVLYIALQVAAQGVLGAELARQADGPLAAVASRLMGSAGGTLILVATAISTAGYVSGMILSTPRTLYALGRDGFLPRAVASVHPRFHTPHVAIALQAVLVFVLAATGSFARLAILANISVLLLYLACCAAAWVLQRRDVRAGGVPFRLPGGPLVPLAAAAVVLALLANATRLELLTVLVPLALAAALYLLARARGRRAAPAAP